MHPEYVLNTVSRVEGLPSFVVWTSEADIFGAPVKPANTDI